MLLSSVFSAGATLLRRGGRPCTSRSCSWLGSRYDLGGKPLQPGRYLVLFFSLRDLLILLAAGAAIRLVVMCIFDVLPCVCLFLPACLLHCHHVLLPLCPGGAHHQGGYGAGRHPCQRKGARALRHGTHPHGTSTFAFICHACDALPFPPAVAVYRAA
jgi:hypothetical protein